MDDPFTRLEKDEEDKTKASEQHKLISNLYEISHRQWSDPWTQSQKLRKTFREEKKVLKQKAKLSEEIRTRNGLHIDLLPEAEEDAIKAKMIEYTGKEGREASLRQRELKTGSLVLGKRDRTGNSKKDELERVVKINTRERADPFLNDASKVEGLSLKGAAQVVKKENMRDDGNVVSMALVEGYSSEEC
jgi:coiled-coil domain-containing protein 130